MAGRNFDWKELGHAVLRDYALIDWLLQRYDGIEDVVGREDWRRLVEQVISESRSPTPDNVEEWRLPRDAVKIFDHVFREFVDALHRHTHSASHVLVARKRLFISHRQADDKLGERVACIAQEHRYAYWLDVHDPLLQTLGNPALRLPPMVAAVLTAAVIEMALINCSHVIALVSTNARGSAWIPYELGRAKKSGMIWSLDAASWVGRSVTPIPEYLYLAPIHRNEADIRAWLGGPPLNLPCRVQTQKNCLDT